MIFNWKEVCAFFAALAVVTYLIYPSEYFRGQMHRRSGNRAASIAFFEDYLRRNPYHKGATYALAAAFEGAGRPEEGVPLVLDFYRHRRPDRDAAWTVIRLLERCLRRAEAIDFRMEHAADILAQRHPDRRLAESVLYEAYQRAAAEQDDERTMRALEALASAGGDSGGYMDQALRILIARGRFEDALRRLRASAAAAPKDPEPRRALVRLFRLKGDTAAAFAAAQEALALVPDDVGLLGERAAVFQARGEWGKAEADFRLLIALQPAVEAWPQELARCHIESGRLAEGIKLYDELIARSPEEKDRWWPPVYALSEKGFHDQAADRLERYLARFPSEEKAFKVLIYERQSAGQTPLAVAAVRRRIQSRPRDPALRRNLVFLLQEEDKAGEALEELQALAALTPDDPAILPQVAFLQRSTGRTPDAIQTLRSHIARFPEDMAATEKLAALLSETGDKKGAIEILRATFAPPLPSGAGVR